MSCLAQGLAAVGALRRYSIEGHAGVWLRPDEVIAALETPCGTQPRERCECARGRRNTSDAMTTALERFADSVERDRHEPDKLLCHVQSVRGFLLRQESPDAQPEE